MLLLIVVFRIVHNSKFFSSKNKFIFAPFLYDKLLHFVYCLFMKMNRTDTVIIEFMGQFIELPMLKDPKRDFSPRTIHDGIAFTQQCMDDEWERWERSATLEWDRRLD